MNAPDAVDTASSVAVCVFDLNNLRSINNNLGHDKGDEYIRTFAIQLRKAIPAQYFVGRDGGDEFIAIFHNRPTATYKSVFRISVSTLMIIPHCIRRCR